MFFQLNTKVIYPLIFNLLVGTVLCAQSISATEVISVDELKNYLRKDTQVELKEDGIADLASHFRTRFSERFFYDYSTVDDRLTHYNNIYSNGDSHKRKAIDHLSKYSDSTQWVLPFNYLNGEPVNAYALRHLARQHKMVDIILYYFNESRDPKLIKYFESQMRSLNAALQANQYEKIEDGNGVYEAFRSGYRILNWLWIHNMLLNEAEYSDEDQLNTIATLLQHGQHLYERNAEFSNGNHQTRGVSALAMLAILFNDFKGTDLWLERAMLRLSEHLEKEINSDGFQFERSVHYHMSDINNYFYVYQLAKINGLKVDTVWENKLRGLFTSLVKIAYPDRSAPVLQDDTEIPWAEKNDISAALTLGYLLFEDPVFGYFATERVDERVYWFLDQKQILMLANIKREKPNYGSLGFIETGYFIMREGWDPSDKMMVVSAGLDPDKPDHQHGDMLGIQAISNGHVLLPNYQVRYSLKDFEFFKNSMVKNVALVDNELQGKEWTSNKGGSGFGKFRQLPNPKVIAWETNKDSDLFVGSHDGFENIGVRYSRQVIYVKDEFWIVKDNFSSNEDHDYKQVWQGHYTHEEGPNLIRANNSDATGHDILQLISLDSVSGAGTRGKEWSIVVKSSQKEFSFITIIYPYKGYSSRLDEESTNHVIGSWQLNQSDWELKGNQKVSLSNGDEFYFFGVNSIRNENFEILTPEDTDLYMKLSKSGIVIQVIGDKGLNVSFNQQGQGSESNYLSVGEIWQPEIE